MKKQLYLLFLLPLFGVAQNQSNPVSVSGGCTASITSVSHVTCFGDANGSATASVSGSFGTLNYVWTPSGGTGATASGLAAGTYTVTVTDGAICFSSATVTINEPAQLVATVTSTDPTCNGGTDGTINATVSGGTTFGANSPGLLISEVNANPTGTDSAKEFVELIATKDIDFSVTPYSVVFANNGTATANGWINGLSNTYAFEINSGSVTQGQVVYVGGTQMIPTVNVVRSINTVTTGGDGGIGNPSTSGLIGNGGTSADAVAVFNLPIASVTSTTVPIDAIFFGQAAGNAVVTSGTAGFELPVNDTYPGGKLQTTSFIGPEPQTNNYMIATGTFDLAANTFTTGRSWTIVPAFTNLSSSVSLVNPYMYSWTGGAMTEDVNNVSAGTYTLTVTDASSCTVNATVTVTEPAPISISETVTDASCNGSSDGEIDITVTGAQGTATYQWNGITSAEDQTGLAAGTYTVVVTDTSGCVGSDTLTVDEPTAISMSAVITDEFAGNDGAIDLTVSGGTGNYTYLWSNTATTEDLSNIDDGYYVVIVTDANACEATDTFLVNTSLGLQSITSPTSEFSFYPNPAANAVTLINAQDAEQIEVLDAKGALVASANGNTNTIDFSKMEKGIYFIAVTKNGERKSYRVVKQ